MRTFSKLSLILALASLSSIQASGMALAENKPAAKITNDSQMIELERRISECRQRIVKHRSAGEISTREAAGFLDQLKQLEKEEAKFKTGEHLSDRRAWQLQRQLDRLGYKLTLGCGSS